VTFKQSGEFVSERNVVNLQFSVCRHQRSTRCPPLTPHPASLRQVDVMCQRPRRDRRNDAWPYISIHILCILCVVIRIYTKALIVKKFSPEDWLSLASFVIYIVYFGIGHHGKTYSNFEASSSNSLICNSPDVSVRSRYLVGGSRRPIPRTQGTLPIQTYQMYTDELSFSGSIALFTASFSE
jgi:hypothetical protein